MTIREESIEEREGVIGGTVGSSIRERLQIHHQFHQFPFFICHLIGYTKDFSK